MVDSNIEKVVRLGASDDVIGAAIEAVPFAMVLTDPRQDDNPITFVNEAFEKVTLYSRQFAIGRNCRFLQGDKTDPKDVGTMRDALRAEEDIFLDIANYKADGTPFLNRLMISPIHDEDGEIVAFVGVQRELSERERQMSREVFLDRDRPLEDTMLMEVQHRVKNHLAMIVSMIRMQAAKEISRKSFEALSHRVRGLALLYDELSGSGLATRSDQTVSAGAYLNRICSALAAIEGRGSIRVNVDCDEIEMPVDLAARLGLPLSEFLTNALQHAFDDGRNQGVINVRFSRMSGGRARLVVEDDGHGLPEGSTWPWSSGQIEGPDGPERSSSGLGGSLIVSLAESMDARVNVRSSGYGTIVTIDVPNFRHPET